MNPKHASLARHIVIAYVCALALSSQCFAQRDVATGPFAKVEEIESQLKQGVSTKADVQHLLGAPSGLGQAVFPPLIHPMKSGITKMLRLRKLNPAGLME